MRREGTSKQERVRRTSRTSRENLSAEGGRKEMGAVTPGF